MNAIKTILLLALLSGCTGPRGVTFHDFVDAYSKPKPRAAMPPAPPITKAGAVGERLVITNVNDFTVTVSWNNYPDFGPTGNAQLRSGLEASTDNIDWQEIGTWPYASVMIVTLTNRPSEREFYRSFNRLKP